LHEFGLLDLPERLVERQEALGEAELALLKQLPLFSAARLLSFSSHGLQPLRHAATAHENRGHVPPSAPYAHRVAPDPVAQFIAAADAFDHLTSSRLGHKALRPDQALERILADRGQRFTSWAGRLLADAIGRFPVGTMVELNNGAQAIVFDLPAEGRRADRPRVRVIAGPGVGTVVDLAVTSSLAVVRSLDAVAHAVNVPHFFMD
jgi:hypothetical protein